MRWFRMLFMAVTGVLFTLVGGVFVIGIAYAANAALLGAVLLAGFAILQWARVGRGVEVLESAVLLAGFAILQWPLFLTLQRLDWLPVPDRESNQNRD